MSNQREQADLYRIYKSEIKSTSATLLVSCELHERTGLLGRGSHWSSASEIGPVETGLRKVTALSGQRLFAPLHRSVVKMVFPTSVLAPKTWYVRCDRHSREVMGDVFIVARVVEARKGIGMLVALSFNHRRWRVVTSTPAQSSQFLKSSAICWEGLLI